MYCGNTQKGRNEDNEEHTDVEGLLASLGHSKLVRSLMSAVRVTKIRGQCSATSTFGCSCLTLDTVAR